MEMADEEEQASLSLMDNIISSNMDNATTVTRLTTTTTTTTTRISNFLYIVEPLVNFTINAGREARLRCNVRGSPSPRFRWFKNEAPFEGEKRGRITIKKDHEGSKIRIRNLDVSDTGYYRCEAFNGFDKVETTGILKVLMVPGKASLPLDLEEIEHEYEEPTHITEETDNAYTASFNIRAPDVATPGSCQIYKGTACMKFLKNITVYIGHGQHQNHIEESLLAAFASIPKHTELSTHCTEYAVPSLCFHMFPVCDEGTTKKRPRELCRDECELLESEICRKEYAIANSNPILKQFMPDCDKLPIEQSLDHKKCVRLGLRPSKQPASKITKEECYSDDHGGAAYSGMTKHSVSGGECKKWDGVHQPDFAHHNFCRNPGGLQSRPWCFNAKTDLPEPCNIPKCVTPSTDDIPLSLLYIIIACGALLFLIVLISLLVCWCRRRAKKNERKEAFKANIKTNPLELNALIPKYQIHGHVPEIQMSSLRFMDVMGEGSYGTLVYAGHLTTEGGPKTVIIRLLKETGTVKNKQDFQKELTQWVDFRHPNVTALIGAHTERDPFFMVFEHTLLGDMHEYVLETLNNRSVTSTKHLDPGSYAENLHMATQVAAGLEYLAANCFVHKDVAARNCWVYEDGHVKVADYGIGPTRYPEDYSRLQNHILPVRWMAAESINYNQITLHSSVWSFGVLMWEIWSEGRQPYFGCSLQEILQMIRTRQLLPQPDDCPAHIYALMVECWHENAVRRPSFKELHQRLWNWERGRVGPLSGGDLNNSGRSRSTVSQHSSNGPSNNTGSTHISNGFPIANTAQFNFAAPIIPSSPNVVSKFSTDPRRQMGTQTGANSIIPPSPLLRNSSALNTPQFRGPRFVSALPASSQLHSFNIDRTTNL
ncbi:tyrosine-protein kinase transmembrane receptor ROR2-like [Paramacrobiotus metropolitanus]|uniref:tyrosine-protein kinase transmembrane receptor ROR2-like n=1 Tax=Paramacrobiotus metropolitanus TaxID=2943436 RepID=UPI002445C54E|nr:tyrosine-protein kinase transmembrane receptor ROR2-like [Paramacrobiotus metropolitanus]XP_055342161.1 tyrosine-protein kinase transmembrane receptor ROR2-like [Paramacrobiotus metropolitanus]XP_055342162.1 tyrosine-protein kinase transmembrane receptor ROR2-like [Paramacrobiotus metropolitanus]